MLSIRSVIATYFAEKWGGPWPPGDVGPAGMHLYSFLDTKIPLGQNLVF